MSISVRTRFEVFKRDRFTCAYCGRTPPEVLLHVDHVVPRAAGGSDDIANLVTSCDTCNLGKGPRMLEEGTAPVVGKATLGQLEERIEQAKAYMALLTESGVLADRQLQMVVDAWAKSFGAVDEGDRWIIRGHGDVWPQDASVRRFLRSLTLEDILAAVDIAASKMRGDASGGHAVRYFYGICNRAIQEGVRVGARRSDQQPRYTLDSPEVANREADAWNEGYESAMRFVRSWLAPHRPFGIPDLDGVLDRYLPPPDDSTP